MRYNVPSNSSGVNSNQHFREALSMVGGSSWRTTLHPPALNRPAQWDPCRNSTACWNLMFPKVLSSPVIKEVSLNLGDIVSNMSPPYKPSFLSIVSDLSLLCPMVWFLPPFPPTAVLSRLSYFSWINLLNLCQLGHCSPAAPALCFCMAAPTTH